MRILIAIGCGLLLAACNKTTDVVANVDSNNPPHCIIVEQSHQYGFLGWHSHVDDHAVYCRQP